ncbi:MAG: hypothetical protein LBO05_04160 [Deltaproteobacteria bacterium]|jgi:hypothetical protein|nr:hypothetical protein [Deltaproteobacteria bacterium]
MANIQIPSVDREGKEIRPEVRAFLPEAAKYVAERQWNSYQKADRVSLLLDEIGRVEVPYDLPQMDPRRVYVENQRNRLWAEFEVIKANPNSDLTPERVAVLARQACRALPDYHRRVFAWQQARDIDWENLDLPEDEPSAHQRILKERMDSALEEVSRPLSFALTDEQVAFLKSLNARRRRLSWHINWAWPAREENPAERSLLPIVIQRFYGFGRLLASGGTGGASGIRGAALYGALR